MTGTWLTAVARRLVRRETFARLVSPAIADFQCEAAGGPIVRLRHYAAICAVLSCALIQDLRRDVTTAFDADTRRRVWPWAAVWSVGFAAMTGWLGFRELSMILGPAATPAGMTTALLGSLLGTLGTAMMVAAFCLARRRAPARTIVAASLVLSMAALVTAFAVHPIRLAADRELYDIGRSLSAGAAASNSLLDVWLDFKASDIESPLGRWRDIRGVTGVVNGALFGVILARRRLWMVPLTAVGVLATTILVGWAVIRLEITLLGYVPSYAVQDWRSVAVTFLVANAWLLVMRAGARRP